MTTRVLIWGAIFGVGVYVGVQLCKRETADRAKSAVGDLLSGVGLGPDKVYGRDARTWLDGGIDRILQ